MATCFVCYTWSYSVRLPVCQLKGPWHWRYQQPPLLPHPVQADLHHHHDALQEPT